MNTEKSDSFVKKWKSKSNPLKRRAVNFQRTFNTTPEKLFKLLCPTTEYDWLPGWKCDLLHSESGYSEHDVVFRTSFLGPEEVWVCVCYEPNRRITYSRIGDNYSSIFGITLADNHDGTVTGTWDISMSALDTSGNELVVEFGDAARARFKVIFDTLEHYVNTGKIAG